MSNGVEEIARESKRNGLKKKKKSDDFVQFIARVAIAQICESLGFQGFQQGALDALSDVAMRYVGQVGKIACSSANSAGRKDCNVFDVIRGLEDLGSVQGFLGCSNVRRCLLGSGTVKDIVRYVDEAEEIPFPFAVPEFPVVKGRRLNLSFVQSGESPPGEHIPAWLPAFPNPETYADKLCRSDKELEAKVERSEQVDEHRMAERSAMGSQHQLACNGSVAAEPVELVDVKKTKQAAEGNLFLAPPLQFGEREVSSVACPAKLLEEYLGTHKDHIMESNHMSLLEAFAPAIESVKNKQVDPEEGEPKLLSDTRPSVRFKLGSGRKISLAPMSVQNEGFQRITSWVSDNTVKDEKKRRAEEILNQSIENS